MDIDELQRLFSANPDDEGLRAKLIIALRRSDRDSEAQELVKNRFSCPVSWDQLGSVSSSNDTRHCEQCDKAVHFVSSLEELTERAEKQECIVAPTAIVDQYCDELTKNSLPLAKDSKALPHCMNSFAGREAKLEELSHYERNDAFDFDIYTRFVPMKLLKEDSGENTLILVSSIPLDEQFLAVLTQTLGATSGELRYASQSIVEKLRAESPSNPISHPRPRFKGSVAPPPHIRQQIAARREQERREAGILGWIRRKLTGK